MSFEEEGVIFTHPYPWLPFIPSKATTPRLLPLLLSPGPTVAGNMDGYLVMNMSAPKTCDMFECDRDAGR